MNLSIFSSAMEGIAWRGWLYAAFILHFVFACQFLLLQPLVSAQGTSLSLRSANPLPDGDSSRGLSRGDEWVHLFVGILSG